MIKSYVEKSYVSVDELNAELETFPYAGPDKVDKPSAILAGCDIKQTMCKMWCLFRLLPFMIGERIPIDDPAWELYLVLRSITEYLTAKSLSRGHVEVLRDLIEEFVQGRVDLFPGVPLKPKGHFMLHYCDQILKFGPLVHLWTMRFEAKHQQFLSVWKPIKCSKNVCKTLATRHQYSSALLGDKNELCTDTISLLKPKRLKVGEMSALLSTTLAHVIAGADADEAVVMGTGLCLNRCVLRRQTVVSLGCEDGIPQFVEPRHSLFYHNKYYLIAQKFSTTEFVAHYHCYVVE
jgi:hypothetical protein